MWQAEGNAVKKQPIFRKILIPMMILLVLELLLLVGSVLGQGLISELNNNERTIVDEKVAGRKNYLQNEMIHNWMNLEYTADIINSRAAQLIKEDKIKLKELDTGSAAALPLLEASADDLIYMMRTNKVTGAFMVLNTSDLKADVQDSNESDKPGIYLRNVNPDTHISYQNQDLLLERGPIALMHHASIATDTAWNPQFEFGGSKESYYDFLYKPFQIAYESNGKYDIEDMGYWSRPYELSGEGRQSIAYSIPLILEDGTVYGVLGIDITLDYLQTLLPYEEIRGEETGTYLLGIEDSSGQIECIFSDGTACKADENENNLLNSDEYYTHVEYLNLYNRNAPFSEEQWILAGAVPEREMMKFARMIEWSLFIAVVITVLMGIVGSLFIGYKLTKPIARLSKEIDKKDPGKMITLLPTGIKEIDNMAESIEKLSNDAIETGRKFTQIIQMASIKIAGFEINWKDNTIFATELFFEIFGCEEVNEKELDARKFSDLIKSFDRFYLEKEQLINSHIYQIPDGNQYRFVRLRFTEAAGHCYGLVEDVTQSLVEKNLLKHERDHDPLTNLNNRRAYGRLLRELFEEHAKQIKIGALMMLDLDNLKYVNDTFGHDYGDRYIYQAAAVMKRVLLGKRAYSARISGDEFNIFLYGYDTEAELRKDLGRLKRELDMERVELPGGEAQKVRISGGVAWYPKDARAFDILQKYADYAMYTVKKSVKGEICDFDIERYKSEQFIRKSRAALTELIEKGNVRYAFQPIVSARTGNIFAYEALMRPAHAEFHSVLDILEAAKAEGKLNQIEELTWFKASESFEEQMLLGNIGDRELLFVNSIPNQRMTEEKEQLFEQRFGKYTKRFVLELTEEEQIQKDIWNSKRECLNRWGTRIALDDYGTGYNGEKVLIQVSPDFIKIDIAIIKDIDQNPDKQAMVGNIVNYAHQRGKFIIAEGVENASETAQIIRLGVDYIQGYYISRPEFIPPSVSEEVQDEIIRVNQEWEERECIH